MRLARLPALVGLVGLVVLGLVVPRVEAATDPVPEGAPFSVAPAAQNKDSSVARARSGEFVVVWSNYYFGYPYIYPNDSIIAQRFDSSGVAVGGQVAVSDATGYFMNDPHVDMDGLGNFVVVWEQGYFGEVSYSYIQGRQMMQNGTPVAASFTISTSGYGTSANDPEVAVDDAGNFVVVWHQYNDPGYLQDALGRRFLASGAAIDSSPWLIAVGSYLENNRDPSVAAAADGRFVIAWADSGAVPDCPSCTGLDIRAQRFGAITTGPDGSPSRVGGEVYVNSVSPDADQEEPHVGVNWTNADEYVVSWSNGEYGYFETRAFLAGVPKFPDLVVADPSGYNIESDVAVDDDGDFTLAWEDFGASVFARSYAADGTDSSAVLAIDESVGGTEHAAIGMDGLGNFVVAWLEYEQYTEVDFAVQARLYRCFGPDTDGDGVGDACDNCPGVSNASQPDADTDGAGDECDVCPGFDDNVDTDGDLVPDGCDACPGFDDTVDTDGDGTADGCDACPNDAPPDDDDGDGVCDFDDVCPGFDDTVDPDGDGTPSGCDTCPDDAPPDDDDMDGVCDSDDVCPGFDDGIDADGDTTPDGCDGCPNDAPPDDDDLDGVCDSDDICPGFDDAVDPDGDGTPTGCDPCPFDAPPDDDDMDGVCDSDDACPGFDDNVDTDGDETADGCDPCPLDVPPDDDDEDGVCDSDDACPGFDDTIDTDGDGVADGCDPCPADDPDDTDEDGVCDSDDACPGFDDTMDTDGDGVADGCDPCPADDPDDSDEDGVCDSDDACPGFDDTMDTDGDGVADGCDPCPADDPDDSDEDGVCDSDDACPGFDDTMDTDGDGVADGCDPCPADNPDDSDEDGVCDSDDACPGFDDTEDADGDGVADGCDPCPADDPDDSDEDGVCDSDDACPGFDDTEDADGDGVADGCDPCPADSPDDTDEDGVCDSDDACPGFDDTEDADGDGVADGCDPCPADDPDDTDGDGVCESDDACPGFDDTMDADGDGVADGCDPCPADDPDDTDGDGVCESADACPGFDDTADADGDGVADGCDPCPADDPDDSDGDGACDSADLCPGFDDRLDGDGDGTPDNCDGCPLDAPPDDDDGDGVCDSDDDCPGFDDRADADGDGTADGCDACPLDAPPDDDDNDGTCDSADLCPGLDDRLDADLDGTPDGCDGCPLDANKVAPGTCGCGVADVDGDEDSVVDCVDNCPTVFNPDQVDTDGDGEGDACFNARPVIDTLSLSPNTVQPGETATLTVQASDVDDDIVGFEVFIDVAGEPGTGQQRTVPTPGMSVTDAVPVDTSELEAGQHLILVRAFDARGKESLLFDVVLTVSPAPIPVVLVPGYHFSEPGPHPEQVSTWLQLIQDRLDRSAFLALNQDSWASPRENAAGILAAISQALSATGASVVDVVAFDAGAFAVRDALELGAAPSVRRAIFVGSPLDGWSVADAFYSALLSAAAGGDPTAQARLAADRALRGLTSAGANAFDLTHRPPGAFRDIHFILLAGQRVPHADDDSVLVASALGLTGPNVGSAVYRTATAPRPLHFELTRDLTFFDDFLTVALEGEGGGLPTVVLGGVGGPTVNSTFSRATPNSVQLSSEHEPGGKFSDTVMVADDESVTFTQYAVDAPVDLTVQSPSGKLFSPEDAEVEERVSFASGTSDDGFSFAQYTLTEPAPGDWTFNVDTGEQALTFGKIARVSDLQAAFGVDGFTFARGEVLTAALQLTPASAVASAVTATLVAPDGAVTTLGLRDDGFGADQVADDDVYTAAITLPDRATAVGRWSATGTVTGTLDGQPFEIDATVFFDLTSGEITSTGNFTDSLVDEGGDGTFETLSIAVELAIDEPGDYVVAGKLTDPDGEDAGSATVLLEAASAGMTDATLAFDTQEASTGGVSGKFVLSELVLARSDDDPIVVSQRSDVFETSDVDANTLAVDPRPRLRFVTPAADSPLTNDVFRIRWVDSDPDSSANIRLFLDSNESGFDGTPITGAQAISEDAEQDFFDLVVSGLAEGEYFVHATISDNRDAVRVYASAPIRVGTDTDQDGLFDSYENANGLNAQLHDSGADTDRDGLTNGFEAGIGTSPVRVDSDAGGESDGREVLYGRDPTLGADDLFLPFGAALGDVAPSASPDGVVSIIDVVRILRFAVLLEPPTDLELLRADVAPALLVDGESLPQVVARRGNARIDVTDVVLTIRSSVQLVRIVEGR